MPGDWWYGGRKTITTFRPHQPELLKFNICFLFFSNLISNKEQVFEYLSAAPGRRVIIVCHFISRDGEIGKRCRGRPGETVQSNPIRGRDCDPWLLLQVRVLFTQTLGRVAVSLPVTKVWRKAPAFRHGDMSHSFNIMWAGHRPLWRGSKTGSASSSVEAQSLCLKG